MSKQAVYFLKKALGEDLLESLKKTELYKPDTRTVTSLEDIHLGLKLVPRTLMAILIKELVPMKVGEHKELRLPVMGEAVMPVEKLGPDVYSGQIIQENKKVAEFAFRPIPGVALVIMSTFELYEAEQVGPSPSDAQPGSEAAVMKLIDDRLALHDLVHRVVDRRMEQKDAVQQIMMARLTQAMAPAPALPIPSVDVTTEKGSSNYPESSSKLPLAKFLDGRNSKLKKNEFLVSLEKHDKVNCGDCGKEIFNESGFSGCICYGENMKSKVSIQKSEHGLKISFGRGWDQENLEMLLEVLRSKKRG